MSFKDIFKSSFLERTTSFSIPDTLISLALAFALGMFIYFAYKKTYQGVVFSRSFGVSLVALTLIGSFIILAVTSNVVLSLGMVGALSIVRFRSAIKDPLDVGFLFWGVGAGITAGAGLYFVAIIGTVFVAALYIILTMIKKERRCYLLVVRYGTDAESNVNALLGTLKYKLKNKTQINDRVELTVEIKTANNDTTQLSRFKAIDGVDSVTLLEYNGEYMN